MKNLKTSKQYLLTAIANIKYSKSHNYKKEIEHVRKQLEEYFKANLYTNNI